MIDITISVPDKEYPFFMELVKKLDYAMVRNQPKHSLQAKVAESIPDKSGSLAPKAISPSLEGSPLSEIEFQDWIIEAEKKPTVTLQQAKNKWAEKKKALKQLTR
jgi:hypothetical protein